MTILSKTVLTPMDTELQGRGLSQWFMPTYYAIEEQVGEGIWRVLAGDWP